MEQKLTSSDTIAAIATPPGTGGIAVIRISGPEAIDITQKIWSGKKLKECKSHTIHLGNIIDTDRNTIDEAVISLFLAPNSYTGEDTIEISCHGSTFIQREILHAIIDAGARLADHGEFTRRAFINGKIDLTQAEGIADLIASSSRAAHKTAISQVKGVFSSKLEQIRSQLISLASLLELELDFSEEDIEFADRTQLLQLSDSLDKEIAGLISSYATGYAFRNGIATAIAGIPNAGKSTLLNQILSENKAIVSDIPGTTRDSIEGSIELSGTLFRFIDTAGIHKTTDKIEQLGIERTHHTISKAHIIIWLIDPTAPLDPQIKLIHRLTAPAHDSKIIITINKADIAETKTIEKRISNEFDQTPVTISAKNQTSTSLLIKALTETVREILTPATDIIVTNARHYEALTQAQASLEKTIEGIRANLSPDFIAQDLRETLHHIGTITGAVTTDTLLHTIFSRFCIGK